MSLQQHFDGQWKETLIIGLCATGNGYRCFKGGKAFCVGVVWLPFVRAAWGFPVDSAAILLWRLLLMMGQSHFRHTFFPKA